MFSRVKRARSGAGRMLALLAVTLLLSVVVLSGGLLLGGVGLIDDAGHSGIALAQSEEEEDSRTTGVTVSDNESGSNETTETNGSGDAREVSQTGNSTEPNESTEGNESNEPTGSGEPSPTEERAASETGGTVDGVNDANETRTATEERADSEVPAGPNESGSERAGVDSTDDEDEGVGFVAQRMLDMIDGLTTQVSNEFGGLASQMLEMAVSRSAPGVADDPSTWTSPEDPQWQGSIDMMELTRFMGMFIVLGGFLWSIMQWGSAPAAAKKRLKWCVIASLFLLRPAVFSVGSLHLSNSISTTIAPGAEAFSTPEGVLLVGLTVIAAGILAGASIWIIVAAAFVTVIAHNAGFVTVGFLPLAVSLYVMPMYLRSIGEMIVYLHGVTVTMPIFQAISTLGVSRMFLTGEGVLSSLSGVLMFLGVVYLVFYLFQKEVLEKAFDAPITSLGVHGAQVGVEGARNTASNIANAPQAFRDMKANIEANIEATRSKFTGSDGAVSTPNIGSVQAPAGSRVSAVADGGSDGSPMAGSRGSGPDAKSWGSRPVSRGSDGRFQSIDVAEARERDRMANGDY